MNTNHTRWLIDRADHLRALTASSAGSFVAALSIMLTGLSYGVGWAWEVYQLTLFWIPLILVVAWVMLVVAFFYALDSLSLANGFSAWGKSEEIAAAFDVHEKDNHLRETLRAAAEGHTQAAKKLKVAAWLIAVAAAVIVFAGCVRVIVT